MEPAYDRDRAVECMFDPAASAMLAELEDGAKTCWHLADASSSTEEDVLARLGYLIECGFVVRGTDDSGRVTLEADSEKLSELVEDGDGFGAAVEGLEKMDSYLN